MRYERTPFVPGDETVLHVFKAISPEALREAALAYRRKQEEERR